MTFLYQREIFRVPGGISGNPSAVFCCINTGTVLSIGNSSAYAGGIAGDLHSERCLVNCFNTGSVTANCFGSSSANSYAGGIAGRAAAYASIINSCNLSLVNSRAKTDVGRCEISLSGGIVGSFDSGHGIINNCYNAGVINCSKDAHDSNSSSSAKGILGSKEGTITTCYYLSGTAASGAYGATDSEGVCESLTETEMKSEAFVNTLNANKAALEAEDETLELLSWKYQSGSYPTFQTTTTETTEN